jgi:ribosome maturation factor RimP
LTCEIGARLFANAIGCARRLLCRRLFCFSGNGKALELGVAGGDLAERIAELVCPAIEGMGYALVRTMVSGRQRMHVQIMVERADNAPMQVDDCAEVSRAVSAILDVADPVPASFTLEVSSPGIDRPLVRLTDYDRFSGFEAKVELARLVDGRRKYQGRLLGTTLERHVRLMVGESEVSIAFDDILRAKLVLTDDLIGAQPQT